MTSLLEFASGWLDGFSLLAFSLLLGGLAYSVVVLQAFRASAHSEQYLFHPCFQVIFYSGATLLAIRLGQLGLKYVTLGQVVHEDLFNSFLQTQLFRAGLLSAGLLLVLLCGIGWIRRDPTQVSRWIVVLVILCGLLANEARLTHAASRLENREWLMTITMIHVMGALVWAGGIGHLLLSWWIVRRNPSTSLTWPPLVAKFSFLGIPAMVLIIGPGLYLAWQYVGGFKGLVGTGYGNMVFVKIGLLLLVLSLAILNFRAGRRWAPDHNFSDFTRRVSAYVEIEIILAVGLLFTAASLNGFPPAIDVAQDSVTPQELRVMFEPKWPRVSGPERVWIDAPELTNLRTGQMGKKEDVSWDRFNHNLSGVILIAVALVALIDLVGRVSWARRWPLMFVGFSILIFVFSNPDHWPLGTVGFVDSLLTTEVVQHWLAAFVVLGLGWFEWRGREWAVGHETVQYIFPSLCIVGGIILLTHSHSISELKTEFLAQSTHVSMGFLGVVMGCARWLELRLSDLHARWAGLVSVLSMMLVGFILLFYVNPELLDV